MRHLKAMMALAREMRERAYAPYSNHAVGAVLRTAGGKLYGGCNVENAAYPEGTCAEAGAIAAMVAGGERLAVEVLVMGPDGPPCTPCGGCRQKLTEFCPPSTPVHICDSQSLLMTTSLAELFPHAFGPDNVRT